MFNISDATYDFLSKLQRWLPAIGAAYIGLCGVWGLPLGDQVNETIAIAATLLASYLEISTVQYHKTQNMNLAEILEEEEEEETLG